MAFLPTTYQEMTERGWSEVDFVYICGDAYVDHPSFGCALITRLLEAHGYKVGIIAQPDWKDVSSIQVFGEPRLAFLVSAGNMDSMVNHYTVAKKRRSSDAYSPGNKTGLRPDRACIVYGNLIRKSYKHTPIILGGIEASLRRLAHYDYWQNNLRRSILLDSGADLISYGMGEHSIIEIAEALESGLSVQDITFIPGTVYRSRTTNHTYKPIFLPSFEECKNDTKSHALSFSLQYRNLNPYTSHTLIEAYPHDVYVIQNPPSTPLTQDDFDSIYELPFERAWHPAYDKDRGVPALNEVRFSLTSNRGCLGDCSFCSLNFHQGRIIQTRSHESLVKEACSFADDPYFKGYINDVGGPTANFRIPACEKQKKAGACSDKRCLSPTPCPALKADHSDYISLLKKLRSLPHVKKVFIRSGIRYDYVLHDKKYGSEFMRELVRHHVSGQLRVAPEHVSKNVLDIMGKPSRKMYDDFSKLFYRETKKAQKNQFIVPYLMSSHPGTTLEDGIELALFCKELGFNPEQVQDFYPTPSTLATCMYYTGINPLTMEPVYIERDPHRKKLQRSLIQYRNPKAHSLVKEALTKCRRTDLIGTSKECLIPGRPFSSLKRSTSKTKRTKSSHSSNARSRNKNHAHPRSH